ncbi:hypothetical protein ACIXT9_02205 [Bacteroides fragilis]
MEKKNHLEGVLSRLYCKHGKLPSKTEKVPYSQKEVANLAFYDAVTNLETKGA